MTAPRRPVAGNQARSDRTRATVIDAAVSYINEEGLAPPSVRRITERAGVTWGGAQYHFGALDGVLMALVANGHLAAMTGRLAEIGTYLGNGASASGAERIANLIWATIRGLVMLQMLWPDPLDTSRDREMLVDVLNAYLASAAG